MAYLFGCPFEGHCGELLWRIAMESSLLSQKGNAQGDIESSTFCITQHGNGDFLYATQSLQPKQSMSSDLKTMAVTMETDNDFKDKLEALRSHINTTGGMLPVHATFVIRLRDAYRRNPGAHYWIWRLPMLLELGIDIACGKAVGNNHDPNNIEPLWRSVLNLRRIDSNNEAEETFLEWFRSLAESFPKEYVKTRNFNTLEEFIVRSMCVGDIAPFECERGRPPWELNHTLSYVLFPVPTTQPISPTWRFTGNNINLSPSSTWTPELKTGNSVFFTQKDLDLDPTLFDDVVNSLPSWIPVLFATNVNLTKEKLVELMLDDDDFFDHFPISKKGTNPAAGAIINTESLTNKTPKRMTLFDKINDPISHTSKKCLVQDGYRYSNGSIEPFFGGRSLESHPAIARLKVAVWRKVHHFLSPISKICPPNGIQTLLYLGDFNARMNTHRDINPRSRIKGPDNSQLIGSSVIVISFFDQQVFEMCHHLGDKKYKIIDSFLTQHCSVYVLDPNDDRIYYHRTKFPPKDKKGKIRYALTLRWLGLRESYYGDDNQEGLAHCKAVHNPEELIKQNHKNCPASQQMWLQALQDKKKKNGCQQPAKRNAKKQRLNTSPGTTNASSEATSSAAMNETQLREQHTTEEPTQTPQRPQAPIGGGLVVWEHSKSRVRQQPVEKVNCTTKIPTWLSQKSPTSSGAKVSLSTTPRSTTVENASGPTDQAIHERFSVQRKQHSNGGDEKEDGKQQKEEERKKEDKHKKTNNIAGGSNATCQTNGEGPQVASIKISNGGHQDQQEKKESRPAAKAFTQLQSTIPNKTCKMEQKCVGGTSHEHLNMTGKKEGLQQYLSSVGITDHWSHFEWLKHYNQQMKGLADYSYPFCGLNILPPGCSRYYVAFQLENWDLETLGRIPDESALAHVNSLNQNVIFSKDSISAKDKEQGIRHAQLISKLFLAQGFDATLAGAAKATLHFCSFIDAHNRVCKGWNTLEVKLWLVPMHSHLATTLLNLPLSNSPPRIKLYWGHY